MIMKIAANGTLDFVLRALQLVFAVVVMGTDGYAIHVFRGHTVYEHFEFGDFYDYKGVPNAWGFLLFCAGWTFLGAIFLLIAGICFADHVWIGYTRVGIETVALLSWLAGFIAVAVNIGSSTCPAEEHGCGSIQVTTVFGALEWLLFVVTTFLTTKVVFSSTRWPKTSAKSSDIPV